MYNNYNQYLRSELYEFLRSKTEDLINKLKTDKLQLYKKRKTQLGHIISKYYKDELPPPMPKEERVKAQSKDIVYKLTGEKQYDIINFKPEEHDIDCNLRIKKKDKLTGEIIQLQSHQINFIKKFVNSDNRGAIAIHDVGTGKTLTSVLCSQCYLDIFPNHNVVFISPAGLIANFINELREVGHDIKDPRYKFYSYESFIKKPPYCGKSLLIIDEVHNLKTAINFKTEVVGYDKDGKPIEQNNVSSGKKVYKILSIGGFDAHKVLLLTATPIINTPYDIENDMAFIRGSMPYKHDEFKEILKNNNTFKDYFNGICSIIDISSDALKFYPKVIQENVFLPFEGKLLNNFTNFIKAINNNETLKNEDSYKHIIDVDKYLDEGMNKLKSFHSGDRRVSNAIGNSKNPKIKFILEKIAEAPEQKYLIFSTWDEAGLSFIHNMLSNKGYKSFIINGKVTLPNRQKLVNEYNNNKINILLISKAGAEGLSLLETYGIFIYEPHWNEALVKQMIARGVRYKSHINLPKNKQKIYVWRLYNYVDKMTLKEQVLHDNKKELAEFIKNTPINYIKGDAIFDYLFPNAYFILVNDNLHYGRTNYGMNTRLYGDVLFTYLYSNGDTQYKEVLPLFKHFYPNINVITDPYAITAIIKKYVKLNDNKNNTLIKVPGDLLKPQSSINSVGDLATIKKYEKNPNEKIDIHSGLSPDIYILIHANNKQLILNKFYHELRKCQMFENSISTAETKIYKLIDNFVEKNDREPNYKEKTQIRFNILKDSIKKVEKKIISANDEFIMEIRALVNKKGKMSIKEGNQFFTPIKIGMDLVKYSGLHQNYGEINVLEPTAGGGNLIYCILHFKPTINIDMVEFASDNRQHLEKISKICPTLHLQEEKDFTKYMPNKAYDYIIMNPPFNIKMGNEKWYDIDFVLRAYDMLKENGTLVSIVSNHFLFANDCKKQLEQFNNLGGEHIKIEKKWKGEMNEISKDMETSVNMIMLKLIKNNI